MKKIIFTLISLLTISNAYSNVFELDKSMNNFCFLNGNSFEGLNDNRYNEFVQAFNDTSKYESLVSKYSNEDKKYFRDCMFKISMNEFLVAALIKNENHEKKIEFWNFLSTKSGTGPYSRLLLTDLFRYKAQIKESEFSKLENALTSDVEKYIINHDLTQGEIQNLWIPHDEIIREQSEFLSHYHSYFAKLIKSGAKYSVDIQILKEKNVQGPLEIYLSRAYVLAMGINLDNMMSANGQNLPNFSSGFGRFGASFHFGKYAREKNQETQEEKNLKEFNRVVAIIEQLIEVNVDHGIKSNRYEISKLSGIALLDKVLYEKVLTFLSDKGVEITLNNITDIKRYNNELPEQTDAFKIFQKVKENFSQKIKDQQNLSSDQLWFLAVNSGDTQKMTDLLKDVTVDIVDETLGATALIIASGNGDINTVKYLVSKGGHLDAKDEWGMTPLEVAKMNERTTVVKYLERKLK